MDVKEYYKGESDKSINDTMTLNMTLKICLLMRRWRELLKRERRKDWKCIIPELIMTHLSLRLLYAIE